MPAKLGGTPRHATEDPEHPCPDDWPGQRRAEAAEATAAIVPRDNAHRPKPTAKEQGGAVDQLANLATDTRLGYRKAAVEHEGHTTATHEGAKIIEFRPRKARA